MDAGVQADLFTYGAECGLVGQCYYTSRGCRPLPPTCGEIDLPYRDPPGHLLCGECLESVYAGSSHYPSGGCLSASGVP